MENDRNQIIEVFLWTLMVQCHGLMHLLQQYPQFNLYVSSYSEKSWSWDYFLQFSQTKSNSFYWLCWADKPDSEDQSLSWYWTDSSADNQYLWYQTSYLAFYIYFLIRQSGSYPWHHQIKDCGRALDSFDGVHMCQPALHRYPVCWICHVWNID